jgi:hypothetical protein
MASYMYFPIDNEKFENFKLTENSQLDDQLDFLETNLTYIRSGGISPEIEYGKSGDRNFPVKWENHKIDRNGKFDSNLATDSGHRFYRLTLRTFGAIDLPFYLDTDRPIVIWINGKEYKNYKPNDKLETKEKIILLPMLRGNNEIILELQDHKKYDLCFLIASEDLIIDPTLQIEEIVHLAKEKAVSFINESNFKYHGHGIALTDGYRGTTNFGTQLWQGWLGEPAAFTIDLGSPQKIEEISVGALIDQGSWIFAPERLQFFTSENGIDFKMIFDEKINAITKSEVMEIKHFGRQFSPIITRYIKVIATPVNGLPEWHNSKGSEAWVFLDEVIVK